MQRFRLGLSTAVFAALASLTTFAPAHADGAFLQAEVGRDTGGIVASQTRGAWSGSAIWTRYDGGDSVGLSLTRDVASWQGVAIKAGPSLAWIDDDESGSSVQPGVKVSVDRWTGFDTFGLFTLAEINTADHGWYLSAQASHFSSGYAVEIARGGSDTYQDTTIALRKRLGEGNLSARIGAKLDSGDVFVGLTLNTF